MPSTPTLAPSKNSPTQSRKSSGRPLVALCHAERLMREASQPIDSQQASGYRSVQLLHFLL
jgi:hypothetical protein